MKRTFVLGLVAMLLLAFFTTANRQKNQEYTLQTKILQQASTLSLEHIFQNDHALPKQLDKQHIRILTATGDIIPARSVNTGVIKHNNPLWPYEKVVPVLKTYPSDITFINLETPLLQNCQPTDAGMVFCGGSNNVSGLDYLGANVASLANNHAGNYGKEGVDETIALLKQHGIAATGVNGPVYKTVKGLTFAFLGYNDVATPQPGITNVNKQLIKQEIKDAKKHADVVVVTYHWGTEYQSQPDARQVELGHFTIDSGADLVIGNHPHWIQPIELYKGKVITYAHGNFIFDQMWSEKTKQGVIGRYTFYDKKLIDVEFLPLQIEDFGQAYFLKGNEKKNILEEMKKESVKLSQR